MSSTIVLTKPLDITIGEAKEEVVRTTRRVWGSSGSHGTYADYEVLATLADNAGFRQGSLVCLISNDGHLMHESYHVENWGVVKTLLRYKPQAEEIFKPIQVIWLKSGTTTVQFQTELILINEAPHISLMITKISNAKHNHRMPI